MEGEKTNGGDDGQGGNASGEDEDGCQDKQQIEVDGSKPQR